MKISKVAMAVWGIAGLMLSTPSGAVKLVYMGTNDNNSDFYIDTDSIRINNRMVTVWRTQDAKKDKTEKFRKRLTRYTYDCSNEKFMVLTVVDYFPNGKVEHETNSSDADFFDIVPGSMGDDDYKFACSMGLKRKD
jgi:hypothetical protein